MGLIVYLHINTDVNNNEDHMTYVHVLCMATLPGHDCAWTQLQYLPRHSEKKVLTSLSNSLN